VVSLVEKIVPELPLSIQICRQYNLLIQNLQEKVEFNLIVVWVSFDQYM